MHIAHSTARTDMPLSQCHAQGACSSLTFSSCFKNVTWLSRSAAASQLSNRLTSLLLRRFILTVAAAAVPAAAAAAPALPPGLLMPLPPRARLALLLLLLLLLLVGLGVVPRKLTDKAFSARALAVHVLRSAATCRNLPPLQCTAATHRAASCKVQ